jgi:hypothetical protein
MRANKTEDELLAFIRVHRRFLFFFVRTKKAPAILAGAFSFSVALS